MTANIPGVGKRTAPPPARAGAPAAAATPRAGAPPVVLSRPRPGGDSGRCAGPRTHRPSAPRASTHPGPPPVSAPRRPAAEHAHSPARRRPGGEARTPPRGDGRRRRGRISYAQLGINQLGAVYEALLSYRGFFAAEDLYEVMPAAKEPTTEAADDETGEGDEGSASGEAYGGTTDLLGNGWFVTRDKISAYKNGEKVTFTNAEGRKELRLYPKGTFIYRLAGRDRQKSASYYTPQVLTRCLVKYALKELLKNKTADEILTLTVVEPAMGSAAFLNEAVNQLAEAYLERKQAAVSYTHLRAHETVLDLVWRLLLGKKKKHNTIKKKKIK